MLQVQRLVVYYSTGSLDIMEAHHLQDIVYIIKLLMVVWMNFNYPDEQQIMN